MFADVFRNKTVWVSGHTGFKGSWLTSWLLQLGARVSGFSLPPPTNPAAFDPTTNTLYVSSSRGCSGGFVQPGQKADDPNDEATTGTTISQWVAGSGGGMPGPQGLPIFKPPYNRLSAYNMNTGERMWWIPIGETPQAVRNHPMLRGRDLGNTGGGGNSIQMVTGSLVVATAGGPAVLNAHDKKTGALLGSTKLPATAGWS